ncbi:MAG: penicillin-binding protein 2 [Phycisphaerales bacterium]|nr:penicillin-binding protein 2 [Phycisphaerales bacterium]
MTMNHEHDSQRRRFGLALNLLLGCLTLAFAAVLGRVTQLQMLPSRNLLEHAPPTSSIRPEMANRGDVLDRRGRVLATSCVGYRLFVDPQEVQDPYTIGIDIARLLGRDPVALDAKVNERLDKRYAVLIDLLTDAEVEAIQTANLKGVGLEPVLVRHRPYGDLAAPLIGKVGTGHIGLTGIEAIFNETLTGAPGRLRYLRDVRRRAMWVDADGHEPASDGHTVRLTIDVEMQRIVEEEIRAGVESVNAAGGRAVVFDPHSGEILALTDILRDRPGYGPFTDDPLRKADLSMGRMRCVTDPYEPGSTFKSFVWTRATELGLVELDEVFNTHNGAYRTDFGRIIHDAYPYPELSWEGVMIKSSNIGMAQVAMRLTHRQLQQCVSDFGFGRPTGSGLPAETAGIVTAPAKWTKYTQTSVAMGHEIAVTPLQMVRAFSAFCRDGSMPPIQFVVAAENVPITPYVTQQPMLESTALTARRTMRKVMTDGSGRKANEVAHYRMFGKSGTAELPKPGGYHKNRYVISFIAGAPLDNPRLVVLCVIEDPDRSLGHFGGAICGPIAATMMNRCLEYLGVPSDLALDEPARD